MKNTCAKWFSLTFLTVFLFVSSVSAQTVDNVDEVVKSEMQKQHIPGVSVAVFKNGN